MGSGERLYFSLPAGRVSRGDVLKVRLTGDTARYRSVRIELLQVERTLKPRSNHSFVANQVAVPEGARQVELTVPGSLPNAYSGTLIGWDYEVRLIGDLSGRPDHEQAEAIDLHGTEPTSGSDVSLLSLRTSEAGRLAGLESVDGRQREAMLTFGAIGGASLLFGLFKGDVGWMGVGGIMSLPAVFGAVKMNRKRRHTLGNVQFQSPTKTIRLGQPVEVQVSNTLGESLEVGLVAREVSIQKSGKQTVAVQHTAYENWMPVIGPTVTFPTTAMMPPGFVGDYNALHWMVILRRADAKPSLRDLTARTTLLAITH